MGTGGGRGTQKGPCSVETGVAGSGEDDIQAKQHGFLAGRHVYYVPTIFLVQDNLVENETVGLTRPFFNDLRSRGAPELFSNT